MQRAPVDFDTPPIAVAARTGPPWLETVGLPFPLRPGPLQPALTRSAMRAHSNSAIPEDGHLELDHASRL
jgi:hypothetical protein